MIKYLFILTIFLTVFQASAQQDTINQTDENEMKQGYWIKYDKTKNVKVEEGSFVDDQKQGIWKKYFPNGTLKHEITFINDKPDGYARFYHENGKLSEEGVWKGNKWVGSYKFYYDNGNPSYEWNYTESGKRTGVQKYYHENGNIMIEGSWNDGKEDGVIKEFYADGKLKSEKKFVDGQMDQASVKTFENTASSTGTTHKTQTAKTDTTSQTTTSTTTDTEIKEEALLPFTGNGFHKLYDSKNLLDREGVFKDSKLMDGKRYYYNDKGKLIKTSVYRKGQIVDIIYSD